MGTIRERRLSDDRTGHLPSDGLYVLRIPDQEVQREFQELTACYLNVEDMR